jgi:RNA polymerase sigma-70 factor (ECF subfamily)
MTEAEFLSIYRDEAPVVFRFCAFRTGSSDEAEDITAEAFARLYAKGGTIAASKRVAWLHAVSRNLCADVGRRRRRESADAAPDAAVADSERIWLDERVRNAVGRLSPAQQHVVFLHAIEDLPFGRVGEILGITETAARMRYHRAIATLRPRLTEVTACPETT